jgi:hypothetical protein
VVVVPVAVMHRPQRLRERPNGHARAEPARFLVGAAEVDAEQDPADGRCTGAVLFARASARAAR